MSQIAVIKQVIGLVHDNGVHVVPGRDQAGVTPKIQTGIDGDHVHGSACGFQCLEHRNGQIVSSSQNNGQDAHFHKFGDHGTYSGMRILFRGSGADVAQIDGGFPLGMRDQWVEPLTHGVWSSCAALVVPGSTAIVDPKNGDPGSFEHGAGIEPMRFHSIGDPRHSLRIGEVGHVHRFEQVEESVLHGPQGRRGEGL